MNDTFVSSAALDQSVILPASHFGENRRAVEEVNSSGSTAGHLAKLKFLTDAEFRRRERENLFIVLQKTGWKIKGADGAAELLGIKPSTLISRIGRLRLMRPAETSRLAA
jgi:transcriptional regulator with GAF, ATPase, and Fis domain